MKAKKMLLVAVASLALAACATNPVTGKKELSLIPEAQEVEIGREEAKKVIASIGLYPKPEVQKYVSDLGLAIAKESERPNLPWQFAVLDDPAVNAFALPGGPIFVTRGILTYMNSEAELVSVLGHEIGHVTAKHSVSQMSKAQIASIGVGVSSILVPEIREYGIDQIAGAGLGLLFLKFGRDDERQSDQLGFNYMLRLGYDPREMASMFTTLDRYGEIAGRGAVPEWASTHPAPENRVAATMGRVQKLPPTAAGLSVGRDAFMRQLDGMTFDENPRHGYFVGQRFFHPDLEFVLDFPTGWKVQNSPDAVIAASQKGDAMISLGAAGKDSPRTEGEKFISQQGIVSGNVSRDRINGLDAWRGYFKATTQQGELGGLAAFVSHGGTTWRIVALTSGTRLESLANDFNATATSFARLTDPRALAVEPARVKLVKADRDMTIDEFQRRYPSSIPIEKLATMNGLDKGGKILKGQIVKRVIGGELPK
ncbi:MAG: M48 family metalloprotease [Thermoanaerobaculia bacterium]|nr:M48 family metalloprotease [Thermoanaerobaculia bacterium]